MNLGLLLPSALLALLALAVPLLIHLARREQLRPTVFAALRWLRRQPTPRRRLRFDDWPLLLVRLLLLALLAFWLARPVLTGLPDATPWTVVVPGASPAAVASALAGAGGERRWLAPGFPDIATAAPAPGQPVASLLRQLDAELPRGAPLAVLVPERLDGLDGAWPRLSRTLDWRVLPAADAARAGAAADAAGFALPILHDGGQAQALRILGAAVASWRAGDADDPGDAPGADIRALDAALPDGPRFAWLAAGPLPEPVLRRVADGTDVLLPVDGGQDATTDWVVVWRDAAGLPLVEAAALGEGRLIRFARALMPQAMPELLDPAFPRRLRALLQEAPAPGRVDAAARAPSADGGPWPLPERDLQPWLALLLAALFVLERWMATSRRRDAAA